jgi:hypothetical protein
VTLPALVLDVLAGVEAEAAGPGAQKGQQQEAPDLRGLPVRVLDLRHPQTVTPGTVHHHRDARVAGLPRVVRRVRLLDVHHVFLVGRVVYGRKVAVALVDGIVFGRNGRVDVPVDLLYV